MKSVRTLHLSGLWFKVATSEELSRVSYCVNISFLRGEAGTDMAATSGLLGDLKREPVCLRSSCCYLDPPCSCPQHPSGSGRLEYLSSVAYEGKRARD